MANIDNNRLDRIEKKIDELGEAFIILARVEEKQAQTEQARVESNRRYDELIGTALAEIKEVREKQILQDQRIADNGRVVGYIKWLVGAAMATVVGAVALEYFGLR